MVWQGGQGFRKKRIGSLVVRSTGEELCGWLLRIGTTYVSQYLCPLLVYITEYLLQWRLSIIKRTK